MTAEMAGQSKVNAPPAAVFKMEQNPALLITLLGVGFPLLLYGLLPAAGIETGFALFPYHRLILLSAGFLGILGFFAACRSFQKAPPVAFLVLVILIWPYLAGMYDAISGIFGFYPSIRLWMMIITVTPTGYYLLRYRRQLLHGFPYLKYLLLFMGISIAYFLFYNHHTIPTDMAGSGSITDGDISVTLLISFLCAIIATVLTAVTFCRVQAAERLCLFDRFNQVLLWVTLLVSLYTIIGYPLQITSRMIDGFLRAQGLFSHPNSHSHYLGLVLTYMTGLLVYYQAAGTDRIPGWLLYASYCFTLLAFSLGFSKTAFCAFSVCLIFLAATQLLNPVFRNNIIKFFCAFIVIAAISLVAFSWVSNQSFLQFLQARIDDNSSLNFRQELWDMLLSHVEPRNLLLGYGLTASNGLLLQQMFSGQRQNFMYAVHNGYLQLIYDMGLSALFFFLAFFSLVKRKLEFILAAPHPAASLLLYTAMAMTLYYGITMAYDEMLVFHPALTIVFAFSTMILVTAECLVRMPGFLPRSPLLPKNGEDHDS